MSLFSYAGAFDFLGGEDNFPPEMLNGGALTPLFKPVYAKNFIFSRRYPLSPCRLWKRAPLLLRLFRVNGQ